jgi:dGTPase
MRDGEEGSGVSVEGQVMDLSDDIAYSVHDFEDAIVGGFLDPRALADESRREEFFAHTITWSGRSVSQDQLEGALSRLQRLPSWPTQCDGTRADLARLKNFTSTVIGRFAQDVSLTPREGTPARSARHQWDVSVSHDSRVEIDLLKGLVATSVMSHHKRVSLYERQRKILTELLNRVWESDGAALDDMFADDFEHAATEDEKRRIVVDQVASLTDQTALVWHERLQTG